MCFTYFSTKHDNLDRKGVLVICFNFYETMEKKCTNMCQPRVSGDMIICSKSVKIRRNKFC